MIVVYVAGPYTAPNAWEREQNIRAAEAMAVHIARWTWMTVATICPHTMARYWHGYVSEANAIAQGLELVRRSDALVLVGNWSASAGTKTEIELARSLGKGVFGSVAGLGYWLHGASGASVEDGADVIVAPLRSVSSLEATR